MPDYDISQAFARIEDELISSMFRNFNHHRAEETKEGFNWEMWQVRQLKALEEYRKANKKRFTKEFSDLNSRIDEFIRQARSDGAAEQEIAILEAVKKGYVPKNAFTGTAELAADFIKLNDRKMDALINATTNDLKRAEHAMLRMADDQYRKIIFNAQVYAASGAGTYEKAVDMAARDFLKAGINCIEYKNGARHTMQDYVSMVLSTTGKRAYLTGEGEMRKQWGESLVIMNKRGNPCPLCAPFVGKVLVDDVWSGGKPDGVHLLMSTAIDKGLYHPRCKDGHTTYFEGISDEGEPYTESERRELIEQYNAEQKSNYAKNQAEKCARIAMYSLDAENKKVYAERAEKWREIAEESVDKSGGSTAIPKVKKSEFVPAKSIEEAQEYAQKYVKSYFGDKTFKGNANFKGISIDNANEINRALTDIFDNYDFPKISGIKPIDPLSAKGKKIFSSADAVMAYSPVEHGVYINKNVLKNTNTLTDYHKSSNEAWETVMDNIDKLSGPQKELALRYKEAGRALVGDGSAYDYFVHEIGHHIEWEVFDAKTNNLIGNGMKEYAGKISGYATSSKSEYFAESFSAFVKGEYNKLDPEYIKFIRLYDLSIKNK